MSVGAVGERERDALVLRDRLPERDALLRVLGALFQRPARETDAAAGVVDAPGRDAGQREIEAAIQLADERGRGHAHVGERDDPFVAADVAEQLDDAVDVEARASSSAR